MYSLINTKKAFVKLYMFYFETFRIHLQSKNKATLGNANNSKPKDSVMQEITVWRKRRHFMDFKNPEILASAFNYRELLIKETLLYTRTATRD